MMRLYTLLLVCMISLLSACGGGGGGNSDSTVTLPDNSSSILPEGLYEGTGFYPNASGQFFTVIEGNRIWTSYFNNTGWGLIYGVGTISNGTISSPMMVYASTGAIGSLTGSVVGSTFSGSTTFFSVSGTPPTPGVPHTQPFSGVKPAYYNYDTPATRNAIAGNWSITGDGISALATVDNTGIFSGEDSRCSFQGSINPHSNGKNLYQVAVTFTDRVPNKCIYPGTFTGIGVIVLINNVPTTFLMGLRSDGTAGAVLTVGKPN